MIDQDLINHNAETLSIAFKNSRQITSQLRFIQNPFDQPMLLKLQEYVDAHYHSELWSSETTDYGQPLDNRPRHKLAWDPESVVEEMHEVCHLLTPVLQELDPTKPIVFDGITLWRDQGGYDLNWHTDNPAIHLTMQIYLFGSQDTPGTEFKIDSGSITAPFVPNTGYFVDQRIVRPTHRLAHMVPENQIRYSLFALWKNIS
jgi:hypothetical protein